ncbi:iron complex transport system substrate-binding protein [Spirosoma oryzae]|uniref:Iron complex transport system substrate-binding protein n=1 Tax=Spirosoma oryzae TaxID=1469603 RepID=A0A2T0RLS0_9BACT|nr:ABC transporter substrate-binding protein [Spirosoma oryzae]PRY22070.1 iron complex transport system substrate-binding protein [Spirosoma oryzae]
MAFGGKARPSVHTHIAPFAQCKPRFAVWFVCLLAGLSTASLPQPVSAKPAPQRTSLARPQVAVRYAKGFAIRYSGPYKFVSIMSPFDKSVDTVRYVLVPRGTPAPKGYAASQVIDIPLRSIVAMSSMHVGLAEFLGAEDLIVGLGNLKYVSSPKVIQRIDAGKVREVGRDQTINDEQVITIQPDLLMAMGSPTARLDHYRTIRGAGVPVLINSEWVETTPLGRAEWVKLLAALLNKETLVNQKFAKVEQEYNRLAALTKPVARKPTIISGMNSKDAWYVPDGDSYMTRFFLDAGGKYPWVNRRATGSLPLNFEAVYPIALTADYWLNVGMMSVDSKQSVLAKDVRYADFKAFKTGRLYSYTKRVNSRGSNDFWESGAVNPHLVLADLIRILHPDLLPKHQLIYYQQLN